MEKLLEINLSRGRGENIPAAHDFGHPAHGIINDNRQLVSVNAVGTADDEVADFLLKRLGYQSLKPVCKRENAIRHAEPHGRLSDGREGLYLFRCKMGTFSRVDESGIPGMRCKGGMQFIAGTETGIDNAGIPEHLESMLVNGSTGTLIQRRLIPPDREIGEVGQGILNEVVRTPGLIKIFNAQKKASAGMTNGKIGDKSAHQVAGMQIAAGSRGKTPDRQAHTSSIGLRVRPGFFAWVSGSSSSISKRSKEMGSVKWSAL